MKITYDAKIANNAEKQLKELARNRIGVSAEMALKEIEECPVCHSKNIKKSFHYTVPDDTGLEWLVRDYYAEGECEDCGSEFKSETAFHTCSESYSRTYNEHIHQFEIDEDYEKTIKHDRIRDTLGFIASLIITIGLIALMIYFAGLSLYTERYVAISAVIFLFALVFGVITAITIADLHATNNAMKMAKERTEALNEYIRTQARGPFLVEGVDDDTNDIIDAIHDIGIFAILKG